MSVLTTSRTGMPARPGAAKAQRRRTAVRSSYNLIAGVFIVLIGFPVYWMVATALKPGNKALTYANFWPNELKDISKKNW